MNMRQRKRQYFRKQIIFVWGKFFTGPIYTFTYSSQYLQGKKVLYV